MDSILVKRPETHPQALSGFPWARTGINPTRRVAIERNKPQGAFSLATQPTVDLSTDTLNADFISPNLSSNRSVLQAVLSRLDQAPIPRKKPGSITINAAEVHQHRA